MKFFIALMPFGLTLYGFNSLATESPQRARFSRWINILDKTIKSSDDSSQVADRMVTGLNRIAAFNLQGLGRLYSGRDKKGRFVDLRFNFKKLEDAIGSYNKWKEILHKVETSGNGNRSTAARYLRSPLGTQLRPLATQLAVVVPTPTQECIGRCNAAGK